MSASPGRLDVLCVGHACFDILVPFSGLPAYDQKTEFGQAVLEGGGAASTAAVALRRLGCSVGLVTLLGSDPWGQFARQRLQAEGLDTSSVTEVQARTPLSIILCDPAGGARTIVWNRGTHGGLTPQMVRRHWTPARLVLIDEVYPEAAMTALELARKDGTPVLFDAGTAGPGLEELVRGVDHLVPAQRFAGQLLGLDDEREALTRLQAINGRPVVVTRGAAGCWLHDGTAIREFPGHRVQAVDTTGAGDAFHAGLAFGLLQGWPLERSVRFANYYAARNCEKLSGRGGLMSRSEVLEWIDA